MCKHTALPGDEPAVPAGGVTPGADHVLWRAGSAEWGASQSLCEGVPALAATASTRDVKLTPSHARAQIILNHACHIIIACTPASWPAAMQQSSQVCVTSAQTIINIATAEQAATSVDLLALSRADFQRLLGPLQDLLTTNASKYAPLTATSQKQQVWACLHWPRAFMPCIMQRPKLVAQGIMPKGLLVASPLLSRAWGIGASKQAKFPILDQVCHPPRKAWESKHACARAVCMGLGRSLQFDMIPPDHQLQGITLKDLKRVSVLGAGAFGQVLLVKAGTKYYALKCLNKEQIVKMGLQVRSHAWGCCSSALW